MAVSEAAAVKVVHVIPVVVVIVVAMVIVIVVAVVIAAVEIVVMVATEGGGVVAQVVIRIAIADIQRHQHHRNYDLAVYWHS